jgi:cell wall-associated NlpC family hydrolase
MSLSRFVGIPFLLKGTDRTGIDCWNLHRLYMLEEHGVELPSFSDRYARTLDATERAHLAALIRGEASAWHEVPAGQERTGDVVLFRILGEESHIGTVVPGGRFLHARPGTDSCVENYRAPMWAPRVAGFWRHP